MKINCILTPSDVFNASNRQLRHPRMLSQSRSPLSSHGGSGGAWERHLKTKMIYVRSQASKTSSGPGDMSVRKLTGSIRTAAPAGMLGSVGSFASNLEGLECRESEGDVRKFSSTKLHMRE